MSSRVWLKLWFLIPSFGLVLGRRNRFLLRKILEDFRPGEAADSAYDPILSENNAGAAGENLTASGVAVIPGAVDASEVKRAAKELSRFSEKTERHPSSTDVYPEIRVVSGSQDYVSLRDSGEPVAVVREGNDRGMIDIFHADVFLKGRGIDLRTVLKTSGTLSLVESVLPSGFALRNINAYINNGVVATRGFHVDSYGGRQIKAFIYLTDVLSLDDGPYCYVLKSHTDSGLPLLNTKIAKFLGGKATDVSVFDRSEAIPILGKAGTLIVSNQSGAHRGHPQSKRGHRIILALNFQRL